MDQFLSMVKARNKIFLLSTPFCFSVSLMDEPFISFHAEEALLDRNEILCENYAFYVLCTPTSLVSSDF